MRRKMVMLKNPGKLWLLPVFFLLFIAKGATTAPRGGAPHVDFLILGSPQVYTIYNQFEQPLSPGERSAFLPFSPLQIVKENDQLGDQITRALRFVYQQQTFFIPKDEKGALVGDASSRYRQLFTGCEPLGDTAEVIKENAIRISERYPSAEASRSPAKGTLLIRVFRYKDFWYVYVPGLRPYYGWCSSSAQSACRFHVAEHRTAEHRNAVQQEENALSSMVREQLNARMEAANAIYKKYFEHFNRATGQEKSVPLWRSVSDGRNLRWELSGAYQRNGQLEESTRRLVEELENILLGRPYSVSCKSGVIAILPKE